MMKVPDGATVAAMLRLEQILGRRPGASTGTNFWGMLQVAKRLRAQGQSAALVTLLCDSGERYPDTYYNPQWVAEQVGDIQAWQRELHKTGHPVRFTVSLSIRGIIEVWCGHPVI